MIDWSLLAVVAIAAALMMAGGYLWQLHRQDATLVDALWTLGIGGAGVFFALAADGGVVARLALGGLIAIWSLRLAWHVISRHRATGKEDRRYARLRAGSGKPVAVFALVYLVQWAIVPLFALPLLIAAHGSAEALTVPVVAGVVIGLIGIVGEGVADRQLRGCLARTGGDEVCRDGLWAWSRHPNYFFEWLHWFAYPLIAWGAPLAWLAWLGPILMYVFVNHLSGVPPAERSSLASKGDAYRRYQREVSRLIPWPPRSGTP